MLKEIVYHAVTPLCVDAVDDGIAEDHEVVGKLDVDRLVEFLGLDVTLVNDMVQLPFIVETSLIAEGIFNAFTHYPREVQHRLCRRRADRAFPPGEEVRHRELPTKCVLQQVILRWECTGFLLVVLRRPDPGNMRRRCDTFDSDVKGMFDVPVVWRQPGEDVPRLHQTGGSASDELRRLDVAIHALGLVVEDDCRPVVNLVPDVLEDVGGGWAIHRPGCLERLAHSTTSRWHIAQFWHTGQCGSLSMLFGVGVNSESQSDELMSSRFCAAPSAYNTLGLYWFVIATIEKPPMS
jgi:hypothetical protein